MAVRLGLYATPLAPEKYLTIRRQNVRPMKIKRLRVRAVNA